MGGGGEKVKREGLNKKTKDEGGGNQVVKIIRKWNFNDVKE